MGRVPTTLTPDLKHDTVLKMEFREAAPHSTPDQNDKDASPCLTQFRLTHARKKNTYYILKHAAYGWGV